MDAAELDAESYPFFWIYTISDRHAFSSKPCDLKNMPS